MVNAIRYSFTLRYNTKGETDMNESIIEIKHRLSKIEGLKDYQRELEQRYEEISQKLEVAMHIAEKEQQDVEKLQHASLASLAAWFAKDKEERLVKEEQEAVKAAILVSRLQQDLEITNAELVKCEEEIAQEDALRGALEEMQKQEALQGEHGKEAAELYSQLEQEQLLDKELQEAIAASYVVTDKLRFAVSEMSSASDWGMMDIAGGGMMTSMIKHSHVKEATKKIAQLQQDLLRLQKEVKDVHSIDIAPMEIESWLSTADIFFDNFIFDFMAYSRINKSHEQLKAGLENIIALQDQLLDEKCQCLERQNALHTKIQRLFDEMEQDE